MLCPGFEPGLPRPQRGVLTTRLTKLLQYTGDAEFRSRCLVLAKHALFRLSYIPLLKVHRPGIEPGPHAWEARILTIELSMLSYYTHMHTFIHLYICMYTSLAGLEPAIFPLGGERLVH